jgi:hypothetical protein
MAKKWISIDDWFTHHDVGEQLQQDKELHTMIQIKRLDKKMQHEKEMGKTSKILKVGE